MRTPGRLTTFLTNAATLLLIVMVAFCAVLVVGAVAGFGPGGREVAVHTRVDGAHVTDLPDGAMSPDHVDVSVRVRHATRAQIRQADGRDLMQGLVLIAGLWLLRGLLTSVREGDPFTRANVQRLRVLAGVVLLGVPAALLASSMFDGALARGMGLASTGTRLQLPGGAAIGGSAALVLAQVFSSGLQLRDDVEGTV